MSWQFLLSDRAHNVHNEPWGSLGSQYSGCPMDQTDEGWLPLGQTYRHWDVWTSLLVLRFLGLPGTNSTPHYPAKFLTKSNTQTFKLFCWELFSVQLQFDASYFVLWYLFVERPHFPYNKGWVCLGRPVNLCLLSPRTQQLKVSHISNTGGVTSLWVSTWGCA